MQLNDVGHLVNFEQIKGHEIFEKFDTYILEKIVCEMKIDPKKSFEELIKKYADRGERQSRTNKSYIVNYHSSLLDRIPQQSYAQKNLIFFLTLTPAGLTEVEIEQLCKIYKKWFGDFEVF